MDYSFSTIGALLGLAISIVLIIRNIQPAYSPILGALVGGIIGGGKAGKTGKGERQCKGRL